MISEFSMSSLRSEAYGKLDKMQLDLGLLLVENGSGLETVLICNESQWPRGGSSVDSPSPTPLYLPQLEASPSPPFPC